MSRIAADSISSRSGGSITFNNPIGVGVATITNITGTSATITTLTSTNLTSTNVTGTSVTITQYNAKGVFETVSAATTFLSGSALVLELDLRQATTYTYTMPTGANIGIVSFKNMPADSQNGTTVTVLLTQNTAGTGNTTAETGIGTNCTVVPFVNGAAIAGISTRALVSVGSTTTLSTTGSDVDFVSFFIHYTGGTNTSANSYKVYVTDNGNFRRGTVGI